MQSDQSNPLNPAEKNQYSKENLLQLYTRKLTTNKKVTPPKVNNRRNKELHTPGCAVPDKWSSPNPESRKQYDREFLLQLQSQPMSLCKPSDLPNLDMMKYKSSKSQDPLNLTWEEIVSFTKSLKPNESQNVSKTKPKSEKSLDKGLIYAVNIKM